MDELEQLLLMRRTERQLEIVLRCLRQAYRDAGENHDEGIGSDNRTFGLEVYAFSWFRIEQTNEFLVTSVEPKWFTLGGFSVAVHRVPSAPGGGPGLPRDREGWPSNGIGEFDFEPVDGVKARKYLVLAHTGSATDGFRSAFLCVPHVVKGQLVAWSHARTIASRHEGTSDLNRSSRDNRPPEESKPAARVSRKPKRDFDDPK